MAITGKKNSKVKTDKLNKTGKARKPRKSNTPSLAYPFAYVPVIKKNFEKEQKNRSEGQKNRYKKAAKAEQIKYILDNVGYLCREELEEMLWKLAR